ncbi:MAG: glycerate kinase [Bacteroidia bacterium]
MNKEGLKRSGLNSVKNTFPLADGEMEQAEILRYHTQGTWVKMAVKNALHEPVNSQYAFSGDGQMAIIEMANASGLAFIPPEKRNVMQSSTFGTGELILNAVNRGVKEIILGIGGSATNDGGIGMAAALGYQFLDKNGQILEYNGSESFLH